MLVTERSHVIGVYQLEQDNSDTTSRTEVPDSHLARQSVFIMYPHLHMDGELGQRPRLAPLNKGATRMACSMSACSRACRQLDNTLAASEALGVLAARAIRIRAVQCSLRHLNTCSTSDRPENHNIRKTNKNCVRKCKIQVEIKYKLGRATRCNATQQPQA